MKLQTREEFSELPHAVRDSLEALKAVPEADPVVWEQHRHAYLAAVRAEAAAMGLSRVPVSPDVGVRRKGWRAALDTLLDFRMRRLTPMTVALRLVMVVALLLGGSVGTVAAARESLPGSVLYPLKVQLEQWEMARVEGAFEVSEKALSQSQTRFWEIDRLTEKGRTVPDDLAARYEEHLGLALQASGTLTEPLRLQAQARISETLQHQMQTMAKIAAKVGEGEDDQAIQAVIRTMEMTRAQLGIGVGRDEAWGPGDPQQTGPAAGEPAGPQEGVQTGPGEVNEDSEGYGPGDGEGASGPNDEGGYGPGFGQTDNDDGSGSVNGPDNDRGKNGEQQNNTGSNGNR
jgi:hypothetical protein